MTAANNINLFSQNRVANIQNSEAEIKFCTDILSTVGWLPFHAIQLLPSIQWSLIWDPEA